MNYDEARALATTYGQEHIFGFWDKLTEPQREGLLAQVASVDFELLQGLTAQLIQRGDRPAAAPPKLEPAPVIRLPQTPDELRRMEEARKVGEAALSAGRVGFFLVAGGQGTRLGLGGRPKGTFEFGPVRRRSLFQLHAERIKALRRKYGAKVTHHGRVFMPWVIMTSDATDAATRAFFDDMFYFGLGEESVRFCKQANMPAVDRDGKLLLETRASLVLSPNGHGGAIKAIYDSGTLNWLRQQGVDTLSYFQVDNALVRIGDPVFIGHHLLAGAEMSSKVCAKRDPGEKLGIIAYLNGKLSIIEYSDESVLTRAMKEERVPGNPGGLKWWEGSIAIHVLDTRFLERLNLGGFSLPYHKAEKTVPCVHPATGQTLRLRLGDANGVKFETFIFDALPMARAAATIETDRRLDFAPIKNAVGEDSPDTARAQLTTLFVEWLEAAGHPVPRKPDGAPACRIDISPLTSLGGEGLKNLPPLEIKPGGDVVL